MTDTWQSGAAPTPLPPPPTSPPPGWPPAAAPEARPAVNPFLGAGSGKRQPPSRGTLGALIGVAVVAAAGAWFAFGQHGSSAASGQVSHVAPAIPAAPTAPVAAAATPTLPPLASPPTSGIDFGGSPKLAEVLPKIELFVEESRGHRYKTPVAVTPLSNKAFVAALHKADGPVRPDPNDDADADAKALHLLPPGLDVSSVESDDDVGGFYDPATKHLYVRSITLNPLTQSILAHELTHALDDQYFDITKIQKTATNSDQREAVTSLIEGDARSVETHFNDALTTHRKAQEDAERKAQFGGSDAGAGGPSPFVLELFSLFPYEIGSGFIDQLLNQGGPAAVDAAFRKPPTSTLQIIDVSGHFLHRVNPVPVASPAAGAGRVVDRDVAGSLVLAAVLSEAAPTQWLLQTASEAWAGDRYVTTRDGSRSCLRDAIRTTTPAGRVTLGNALTAWSHQHAGASVTVTGRTSLLLVSCTG